MTFKIGYDSAQFSFDPDVPLTDGTSDDELIALAKEIDRRETAHKYLTRQLDGLGGEAWSACEAECCAITAQQGEITNKMWSIRATTNAGKQAKARILFSHVMGGADFREGLVANDHFETKLTELIAELCGMSPFALLAQCPA
jgi:hypothetical protein